MSGKKVGLAVVAESLAVCRLAAGEAVPGWAMHGAFWSVTKTEDELSIVCPERQVPEGVARQERFRAIKVLGPLDFGLTGILAGLTRPLAEAGVSVFALSTYDTDYLLVREERLGEAVEMLRGAGYEVEEESSQKPKS